MHMQELRPALLSVMLHSYTYTYTKFLNLAATLAQWLLEASRHYEKENSPKQFHVETINQQTRP